MFPPGWSLCWVLLTLPLPACGLEASGYDGHEVVCSQGLSDCTIEDQMFFLAVNSLKVQNIKPHFKLCCVDRGTCALCLVIDTELLIPKDEDSGEDESHLQAEEDDDYPNASVTLCYTTAVTIPTCKKVQCTVNNTALTHQDPVKISVVITKADGFSFSDQVIVYPAKQTSLYQQVNSPSLDEVCSQELQQHVPQCQVPTVNSVINSEMNQVELQFKGLSNTLPFICIQYEENGTCQSWNRSTIPLYFVTPCMCLQVWDKDDQGRRLQLCPFNKTEFVDVLQKNILDNVSVSVRQSQTTNFGAMLSWNISAPCRLEGEVWPCGVTSNCRRTNIFTQQLTNGTWKQNRKGHWEKSGVFESIDTQQLSCVMVKVEGVESQLGPFCIHTTDRSRWPLLAIGVMLLVCGAAVTFYFRHDFVKKWVWSWHHGGCVKIARYGHVVVLSPPDVEDCALLCESVDHLGNTLRSHGFSVSVDQWSRKEQCTLGPLPWLHSQLLKINNLGGRVLLVLTDKALERTKEWSQWAKNVIKLREEDRDQLPLWSPYADTFTASLLLIQAHEQTGLVGERFAVVRFDSHATQSHWSDRSLPEPLRGLPVFRLPSQTHSLLTELSVGDAGRRTDGCERSGWRMICCSEMDVL